MAQKMVEIIAVAMKKPNEKLGSISHYKKRVLLLDFVMCFIIIIYSNLSIS